MTEHNSYLVRHRLVPIGADAAPYPPEGEWAEPDVEHAAELMRAVFEHPELAAEMGARAAQDIRRTHSRGAAGAAMAERLDLLRRTRETSEAPSADASLVEPLRRRVQAGPAAAGGARRGSARTFARRLLLRALRPFTAYQLEVNTEVARGVEALARQVHDLDVTSVERHAALLAQARDDSDDRRVWDWITGLTESVVALESATARMERALGELPDVPAHIQQLDTAVTGLQWQSRAVPFMSGSPFVLGHAPVAGLVQGYADGGEASGHMYRSFEDTFRGSEEFIRERQRVYLEILEGREPVLEFGCGRGEFLDLLGEAGLRSLGVDLDAGMVARCHEKGHTQVVNADGLDYLESIEDGKPRGSVCRAGHRAPALPTAAAVPGPRARQAESHRAPDSRDRQSPLGARSEDVLGRPHPSTSDLSRGRSRPVPG